MVANNQQNNVVIKTNHNEWVVPSNCSLVKSLIHSQKLKACDLCFQSSQHCQLFIKRMLLLAAIDECQNKTPSSLATLARELIQLKQNHYYNANA